MYIESPSDHHFGCTRVVIISTLKANCLPVRYNIITLTWGNANVTLVYTQLLTYFATGGGPVGGAEKNKHVITQKKFILILTSHVKLLAFT